MCAASEDCHSSYTQFKDYIEVAGKLDRVFDAVLIDGRARSQCALFDLLRNGRSVVFIHDWNRRPEYHVVLQVYDVVAQQLESRQMGSGGLAVPVIELYSVYSQSLASNCQNSLQTLLRLTNLFVASSQSLLYSS